MDTARKEESEREKESLIEMEREIGGGEEEGEIEKTLGII